MKHDLPLGENPETIAKQAIAILERKIFDEFGLKLRLGAELEYSLKPRHDSPAGIDKPMPFRFGMAHKDIFAEGFAPALKRRANKSINFENKQLTGLRDPLFPDSPYVAYSYNEQYPKMFEAVISHEARHDTLPPDGSRALTFARSIEALRNSIATSNHPGRKLAQDPAHQAQLAAITRDWAASFEGESTASWRSSRTHGLHLNLSVVDVKQQPASPYNDSNMAEAICQTMYDGAYLLMQDDTSLQRDLQFNYDRGLQRGAIERHDFVGIEVRRPSANSNPYYATMLTLLGVYRQLHQMPYTEPAPENARAMTREAFAERFFASQNKVTNTLNQLEPELGTRFVKAIERIPPGQETSQKQASRLGR